jgi:hypothetical protein
MSTREHSFLETNKLVNLKAFAVLHIESDDDAKEIVFLIEADA